MKNPIVKLLLLMLFFVPASSQGTCLDRALVFLKGEGGYKGAVPYRWVLRDFKEGERPLGVMDFVFPKRPFETKRGLIGWGLNKGSPGLGDQYASWKLELRERIAPRRYLTGFTGVPGRTLSLLPTAIANQRFTGLVEGVANAMVLVWATQKLVELGMDQVGVEEVSFEEAKENAPQVSSLQDHLPVQVEKDYFLSSRTQGMSGEEALAWAQKHFFEVAQHQEQLKMQTYIFGDDSEALKKAHLFLFGQGVRKGGRLFGFEPVYGRVYRYAGEESDKESFLQAIQLSDFNLYWQLHGQDWLSPGFDPTVLEQNRSIFDSGLSSPFVAHLKKLRDQGGISQEQLVWGTKAEMDHLTQYRIAEVLGGVYEDKEGRPWDQDRWRRSFLLGLEGDK